MQKQQGFNNNPLISLFFLLYTECSQGLIPHRCDSAAGVWLKLWFIHTRQLVIVLGSLAECGMW